MPAITTEPLENIMETTELKVDGMTCGSCVASITKALKRVPGVEDVQVDLPSGIARVTGEHAGQQLAAFLAALSDAGYEASAKATAASASPARQASCHSQGAAGSGKGPGGCCCH
jgi:Cu+-exporting ATPase